MSLDDDTTVGSVSRLDELGGRRFRGLLENELFEVHIWKVVRDDDGGIVAWRLVHTNPPALRSWGKTRETSIGLTAEEIFPGANATVTFMPIVSKIMESGEPHEWETTFEGTGQELRMVSYPVGPDYFVSAGLDVSTLRAREQELQDTLESLRQAVRDGGVGLWDWDLSTDEVHFSDEWKRQLGYAPHEIRSAFDEWRRRVHPADLDDTLAEIRATIEACRRGETLFRMRHKDGSYRWILAQSSIEVDAKGEPARMRGSHIDVTAQKRMEERVQASQKLEAMGTLAAGIAHDFNNLLTAITGNLSLLQEPDTTAPERAEILEDVETAAVRAQDLTAQLLTFAKGGAPIRELAALRDIVVDSARFVTRGSAVSCVFNLDDGLAPVEVDVGQLNQVINNLVINAQQAMPEGGRLRIGATNVTLTSDNPVGLAPGPYVELSVADDGPGMPSDVLEKIFDPFFSTKPQGSGLGLSTSHAIAVAHGGCLSAESAPGRGTTFHLHLPASPAGAVRASTNPPLAKGSGRVLVMDDDEAVRRLFVRMLDRLGYSAEMVRDGRKAVERYAAAHGTDDPYVAVILDLTVAGGLGARETIEELQRLHPEVVALVASGYSEADTMANHEAHGFRGRLEKPLDLATLSAELARVLADR